MIARLALATLTRRRSRTALTVAGVAVAAAMLLDMVMLGSGMRESFRGFIDQQGFALRVTPRGTMPFDSEATVGGAAALVTALRADPDVVRVGPVLGGKLFTVPDSGAPVAGFLLGIDPAVQGDYVVETGRDIAAPDEIVASAAWLTATGRAVGDTVRIAAGYDAQLRRYEGVRLVRVVGRGRFQMLAGGGRAAAIPRPAGERALHRGGAAVRG